MFVEGLSGSTRREMVTLPCFKVLGERFIERDSTKRSHFFGGVACLARNAFIAFGAVTEMLRKECEVCRLHFYLHSARRTASKCTGGASAAGWAICWRRKLRTVQLYLPEDVAATRPDQPVTIR
jgi:hypothetical protein